MWFTTEAVVPTSSDLMFVKIWWMKAEFKEHFFEVSKGWEVISSDAKTIEGKFVKIVADPYEYEGEQKSAFKLFLNDGEDDICVSIGFNSVGRSIAMSLASLEQPEDLVISLFMNGKYKNASVMNNWEKASWLFTPAEQAELSRKVMDGEKVLMVNRDELDKAIEEKLYAIPNAVVEAKSEGQPESNGILWEGEE